MHCVFHRMCSIHLQCCTVQTVQFVTYGPSIQQHVFGGGPLYNSTCLEAALATPIRVAGFLLIALDSRGVVWDTYLHRLLQL